MEGSGRLLGELREAITDERVLTAVAEVPRHAFVPRAERDRAYENCALPIACQQTISQPLVVARMLELLELGAGDRVLDIGTGSGYHAALLARLAGSVYTVERHPQLAEQARQTLRELGVRNVALYVGDGSAGLAREAPFDAINVAAATDGVVLRRLERQLGPEGRLVAPLGGEKQRLARVRRVGPGLHRDLLEPVKFVPLLPGVAQ